VAEVLVTMAAVLTAADIMEVVQTTVAEALTIAEEVPAMADMAVITKTNID
jgi:hypothetical protein